MTATSPEPRASCFAITPGGDGKERGASCALDTECAAGLGCAYYGPHVCTPFCRTDDDCPVGAAHCYVNDLLAAPGDPIGQCVIWPCGDASAGEPEPWSDGPVWTAEQLQRCKALCASDTSCYLTQCEDSEAWATCTERVIAACAAAPGSSCRAQYVAQVCCEVDDCGPLKAPFQSCAHLRSDCVGEAMRVCAAAE